MGVLGGGWTMESGGGQGRGGWIKESVNLVSVGGWVCVCVGVLSVGLGPGLDSMSPARSRRSASHAAGTHGWLPQKTGRPGLRRGGVGGYNLHSVPPDSPPDCGTVAHQPRAGCIRLVLEALILPSINEFLSPAKDQHGFRPRHSTTSALLQLTTDIETGFNQRKPPHRTVCVAIDLSAAFVTVSHDTLISKIVGSSLPPAITRWLSCYLRGRQAATSFRGTKSSTRIVRTGVPQGSKLSPSLFNYYIDDMPRPTPPVKRVCYADDITVWATGPKIPQLESMINNYLRDVSIYLKDNSLLISAPKSTVTLFTPDKHQFQMHPDIILEDTQLPLERSPKILGVIMDPSISFHKHCNYVSDRIDKRNNMMKALAGSSWGQDKETLLMTYNALGKSIANYAAPVWSTNASDSSFKKIQTAQNAALRTATGAHKMASIDHLHQESLTLRVKDHSDMLSAQYLVNCLEEDHVSHGITIQEPRHRPMKETCLC